MKCLRGSKTGSNIEMSHKLKITNLYQVKTTPMSIRTQSHWVSYHPDSSILKIYLACKCQALCELKIEIKSITISLCLSLSPISLHLSSQTKAHQKQRIDGYMLFSGKETNKQTKNQRITSINLYNVSKYEFTKLRLLWFLLSIFLSVPFLCICVKLLHLLLFVCNNVSFFRHTCRARQKVLPNAILLYVLLICHPDDNSSAVHKRLFSLIWSRATPSPLGTKFMSLFISGSNLYSSLKLFIGSWCSMSLLVYMLLAVKTVAVAVDVSTTAENVVQYIIQQSKLLVSDP